MVGYGASLRRARREGWNDAYINYDRLKQILKDINSAYNDLDTVASTSHHFTPATSYDNAPVATTVGEETPLLETGLPRMPSDPTHDAVAATEATDDSTDHKLEDAHRRARVLAGKFLDLLHSEVEKVFLFSLARQGEIADAVGSLRYADAPVPLRMSVGTVRSSSLLELGRESKGDDEEEEDEEEEEDDGFGTGDIALGETAALLPRTSIRLPSQASPPHTIRKQPGNQERPLFQGDGLFTGALNDLDSYSALGVELLHLLRFVCVNAMAVRKILKKHDKLLAQQKLGGYYQSEDAKEKKRHKRDRSKMPFSNPSHRLVGAADVQLQQLANSDSIAGITASLDAALSNVSLSEPMNDDPSYVRLECIVSSIHVLRQCAEIVNEPFEAFLSRKAMIATGHELGGLGGSTSRALEVLLCFRPDAILLMSPLDLIEWRQLAEDRTLAYPTVYGREMRSRLLSHAEDRQQAEKMDHFGGINTVSMVLNLLSAFLYTVNYYIISPTANHYARQLGSDGAYGATLVGGSSFTAIFAAFIYSFWYTRHTFKSALFFSSLCPVVGNLLYSLAISCDHHKMSVAMAGRLLVGFASAEVVNRMIISTCVSFQSMTQASALFVSASAVGMSIGPLLAAILDMTSGRDTDVDLQLGSLGIVFNNTTTPGFLMAFVWATEMIAVFFFFREPDRINSISNELRKDGSDSPEVGDSSTEVESAPLFSTAWNEVKTVSALITNSPSLPITLLLFAYIELVDEVLISSCSMVVRRYFGWHGSTAGFLIASLGALVLPSHFVVERASRYYEERSIMKWSILFILAGLIGILNYQGFVSDTIGIIEVEWEDITNNATDGNNSTDPIIVQENRAPPYDWGAGVYVYLIFLCAIFMGTIVLEGVDTSLMSKVTPAKLNDTFINCGLLATLVGTVGRVMGDGLITVSALIDYLVFTDFLNDTFFPMIPFALLGYWAVRRYFEQLL